MIWKHQKSLRLFSLFLLSNNNCSKVSNNCQSVWSYRSNLYNNCASITNTIEVTLSIIASIPNIRKQFLQYKLQKNSDVNNNDLHLALIHFLHEQLKNKKILYTHKYWKIKLFWNVCVVLFFMSHPCNCMVCHSEAWQGTVSYYL